MPPTADHPIREAARQRDRHPDMSTACTPRLAVDRLLIIRNDRLGDLILTLPSLNYARQAFPAAEITVLVNERTADLLGGNSDIDRVLCDDGRSSGRELGRRLRASRFDAVAVINTTTRNCVAAWCARIPLRVTWAYKPASWLLGNRRVKLHRSHPPVHESVFALAFVQRLKHDPEIRATAHGPRIEPEILGRVAARLTADLKQPPPWIGVHPGSSHSSFNWPASRYAELVERLVEHGPVVLTGGPGEHALLADIGGRLSPRCAGRVAWYHDFSLLELAAALTQLRVLTVSNTGPMHLAALLGTPVVALFSSHVVQGPRKWEPLGDRKTILVAPWAADDVGRRAVGRPSADRVAAHMCQITVDEVVAANLRYLEPSAGLPSRHSTGVIDRYHDRP